MVNSAAAAGCFSVESGGDDQRESMPVSVSLSKKCLTESEPGLCCVVHWCTALMVFGNGDAISIPEQMMMISQSVSLFWLLLSAKVSSRCNQ